MLYPREVPRDRVLSRQVLGPIGGATTDMNHPERKTEKNERTKTTDTTGIEVRRVLVATIVTGVSGRNGARGTGAMKALDIDVMKALDPGTTESGTMKSPVPMRDRLVLRDRLVTQDPPVMRNRLVMQDPPVTRDMVVSRGRRKNEGAQIHGGTEKTGGQRCDQRKAALLIQVRQKGQPLSLICRKLHMLRR